MGPILPLRGVLCSVTILACRAREGCPAPSSQESNLVQTDLIAMADVDLQELVQRSIQEVLQTVADAPPSTRGGPTVDDAGGICCSLSHRHAHNTHINVLMTPAMLTSGLKEDAAANSGGGPASGGSSRRLSRAASSTTAAAGGLDVNMLEVPSNTEATVRLLKTRVKSLEEQLSMAMAQSRGVHLQACV